MPLCRLRGSSATSRAYTRVLVAQDAILAQQQDMLTSAAGDAWQQNQRVQLMAKFVRVLTVRNREDGQ